VSPIVPLSQYETISNKKESLGNSLYDFVFTDRGDKISTYDLMLPKHPVRNLQQYPQETSKVVAYKLVQQGFS